MSNSKNTTPSHENNLENVIENYNSLIFDEKDWIEKDLWKIAEVTYSYDTKTNVNTTLFVEWGWLNLQKYTSSDKNTQKLLLLWAKVNLEKLLLEKKALIEKALSEVKVMILDNPSDIDIKDIFINSLEEKERLLDYCIVSLPFEVEKAGIDFWITEQQRKEIEEEAEMYDSILFWGKIKDHPEEVIMAYEHIYEIFLENKKKLSAQENKRFQYFLNAMKVYLPEWYSYQPKEPAQRIPGNFLDFDVKKSDYILGFNVLVEALEKLGHIIESNKDAKSISDGPRWVQFPTTKEFETIKMLRFFKLWHHEIETHSITDYNGKQLIWNLRGAQSTEKDEWVAMLMEQLFMHGTSLYKISQNWKQIIDRNKIHINSNFWKILIGEIVDNDELMEFLELSHKLSTDIISPRDRYYRLKRNNYSWVQHKDTTYTRWLMKTVDIINEYILSDWVSGTPPEDLFIGKISFRETEKLKSIMEKKIQAWENIQLVKPLFISDAVYYAIREKLEWRSGNISWENFYTFLQEKYPMFDFSQEQINQVSYKTKRCVFGIVDLMLKNIQESQIENILQWENIQEHKKDIFKNKKWYKMKKQAIRKKLSKERQIAK